MFMYSVCSVFKICSDHYEKFAINNHCFIYGIYMCVSVCTLLLYKNLLLKLLIVEGVIIRFIMVSCISISKNMIIQHDRCRIYDTSSIS